MNHVVRGLFSDIEEVAVILSRLELAGFSEKNISVISNEENKLEPFHFSESTKLSEGAENDSVADGLLSAIADGFAAVGAFAGVGILASGPIASAFLAGAAEGGAHGGVYGTVFPANEEQYYQDCVQQGAIMIVAHCEEKSQADTARQLFEQYDPIKVG